MDWKEIFTNDISDKGLSFEIWEELWNATITKGTTQLKNGQRSDQTLNQRRYIDGTKSRCRDARHHFSSETWTLKHGDITAHLLWHRASKAHGTKRWREHSAAGEDARRSSHGGRPGGAWRSKTRSRRATRRPGSCTLTRPTRKLMSARKLACDYV